MKRYRWHFTGLGLAFLVIAAVRLLVGNGVIWHFVR